MLKLILFRVLSTLSMMYVMIVLRCMVPSYAFVLRY